MLAAQAWATADPGARAVLDLAACRVRAMAAVQRLLQVADPMAWPSSSSVTCCGRCAPNWLAELAEVSFAGGRVALDVEA